MSTTESGRYPPVNALRQADEIRRDAGLLAGEQRAGAAEADRDLVGDQVHAVPVAGFAQQLQVQRSVHAHAGRALHQRFHDHGAGLVRVLRQQLVHRRNGATRAVLGAFRPRCRAYASGEGAIITSISSGW